MISHLQGRLVEKNPTEVVIDCNGVGYLVNVSLYTYSRIGQDEHLRLYTHMIVREDAHSLYGFIDKQERELFRLLISVSGVGAGTARTMLSSLDPASIIEAIVQDDERTIQSIKGIGAKTAKRLIIDLKDKAGKLLGEIGVALPLSNNTVKEEALSALEVLGFARKPAEKVVNQLLAAQPDLTVEGLLKQALKNL